MKKNVYTLQESISCGKPFPVHTGTLEISEDMTSMLGGIKGQASIFENQMFVEGERFIKCNGHIYSHGLILIPQNIEFELPLEQYDFSTIQRLYDGHAMEADLLRPSTRIHPEFFDIVKGENMVCAEVGVNFGNYAQHIRKNLNPVGLYLIDMWSEDTNSSDLYNNYIQVVAHRQVQEQFPEAYLIQRRSAEASFILPNDRFDFIYIDANHTFESVLLDLMLYSKKVKVGGFIAGHDYNFSTLEKLKAQHQRFEDYKVGQAVDSFIAINENWKLVALTQEHPDCSFTSYILKRIS